jgi:hypothetical protein
MRAVVSCSAGLAETDMNPPSTRSWFFFAIASALLVACGGSDGPSGPPVITGQPTSGEVIVGQTASFGLEASGGSLTFRWQTRALGSDWTDSSGTVTQASGSSALLLGPVDIGVDGLLVRGLVANSQGSATSTEARLGVVWGRTSTLEPNAFDFGPGSSGFGSSDGGTPGGGDGDGAGVGGGLGKTPNASVAIRRVVDGASLGEALTGATSGLVRVKAGPGAAPVAITLQGGGAATYYDEGLDAVVPLPQSEQLHALALAFDEHLGVTTLSEAAFRYAVNQFILDPDAVRAGTQPLQRTATAEEIARLDPAQIRAAHEAIRQEINRLLPARWQLSSVATLPTPVDNTSPVGTIVDNRYGRMQVVTGGLALAAARFNSSLGNPALTMARQLADDLTDGVVDGVALDGSSVFGAPGAAYGPDSLGDLLAQTTNAMFERLGAPATTTALIEPTPYRAFADSPFVALPFAWFHLEDWSDRTLNTPGVSASTQTLSSSFGASLVDSVDADDGSIDGRCDVAGQSCDALWGPGVITLTFDVERLGALPDHVGLAFTDAGGGATVTFEAFDAQGQSLGTRTTVAGSGVEGDVAEDRFFGVIAPQGVRRVEIRASSGGIEIDHLQYGRSRPD